MFRIMKVHAMSLRKVVSGQRPHVCLMFAFRAKEVNDYSVVTILVDEIPLKPSGGFVGIVQSAETPPRRGEH